jgi:glycosyltransferase involved in cell wall biosynthesis
MAHSRGTREAPLMSSIALPISVFIIAKDEADRIPLAINSVREWVDEVIVVDSGSADDTVKLSAGLGARTLHRDWTGYGEQKIFGESQCRNDWVLNIDADEEISAPLRDEIIGAFRATPAHSAYTLPILPLYPFQDHGHRWTAFHHPVRLYRRSCAGFSSSTVHDTVQVRTGTVGHLHGMVNHRSFRSLSHHVEKVNGYSSAQAEDRFQKGREPSFAALLLTPPLAFLKSFFLRREFVNGIDGVIVSYMYAFQRFIRLAKTRERFRLARDRRP